MPRPVASAPPAARRSLRLAGFAIVLLVEAVLARRFDAIGDLALAGVVLAAALFGLAAVLFAGSAIRRVWRHAVPGGFAAGIGLLLGLVAMAPLSLAAAAVFAFPPLREVATDGARPLPFAARPATAPPLGDRPSASDAALAAAAYPALRPRNYALSPTDLFNIGRMTGDRLGWQLVAAREPDETDDGAVLDFVARAPILGIPADVTVRLAPTAGGTRLDLRSATRYPGHDLGLNALLAERFLAAFDETVEAPEAITD
jgi:hypothetical protein